MTDALVYGSIAIFVVLAVALLFDDAKRRDGRVKLRSTLLDDHELAVLQALDRTVGKHVRIMVKLHVDEVLEPVSASLLSGQRKAFNKIAKEKLDFVLCEPKDCTPIAAVVFDRNKSTNSAQLQAACEAAQLPLLHVKSNSNDSTLDLLEALRKPLSLPAPDASQVPAQVSEQVHSCPICSGPMTLQSLNTGVLSGHEFWRCTQFPDCRGVVPVRH